MSLKMRDMPRLTASILFNINKYYMVAQEAIKLIEERRKSSIPPVFIDLKPLAKAVDDLADPRNSHTICKVLLPKMNAKLRKLQTEGMFIVGVCYEEANVQPVGEMGLVEMPDEAEEILVDEDVPLYMPIYDIQTIPAKEEIEE